jgi:hypothetical protein
MVLQNYSFEGIGLVKSAVGKMVQRGTGGSSNNAGQMPPDQDQMRPNAVSASLVGGWGGNDTGQTSLPGSQISSQTNPISVIVYPAEV